MTLRAWEAFVLDWAWDQRFCLAPTTVPLTWPAATLKDILWLSTPHHTPAWYTAVLRRIRGILFSRGSERRNLRIPARG